jgi:TPR repeat protein
MRLLTMILVLVMCGAAAPAGANPIEDAVAAYNKRDFATALRLLRPLADQGNAEAQNNLGIMYRNGQGVPRDAAAALTWFHKAAEQGEPVAQLNIGLMYYFGAPRRAQRLCVGDDMVW